MMQKKLVAWMLVMLSSLQSSVLGQDMKILFSTNGYVKELDLDTGNVTILANVSGYVYSMAYDYTHRFLFLPRYHLGDILRLHYSLEQSMETIVPSVSNPADVAIDSLYEHLYWTERIHGGGIGRCNYDGSNITVIIKEDYIWSVTLDLENSWIYYNRIGIGIKRASLNGSDREIIQLKKHQIVAVTFDSDEQGHRLYYMNFDTGEIMSSATDSSNVTIITRAGSQAYDIEINGDDIYCTADFRIIRLQKHPGTKSQTIHTETTQITSLFVCLGNGCFNNEYGMVTSKEFCSMDGDCNITKCKDNITVQCMYGSCSCVEHTTHACIGLFDCVANICTNGGIGTCVHSKCICVHNQACTSVNECSTLDCNTGSVKSCINSQCLCII